jgi:hypothetical protein
MLPALLDPRRLFKHIYQMKNGKYWILTRLPSHRRLLHNLGIILRNFAQKEITFVLDEDFLSCGPVLKENY